MKIAKVLDNTILVDDGEGNIVLYNKSGHLDKDRLELHKWLLLENRGFDRNRLVHLMQLEQQIHSERPEMDDVIDEQVANIDSKLNMIKGVQVDNDSKK